MPDNKDKCSWCGKCQPEVMVHGGQIPMVCGACGTNIGHWTYSEINAQIKQLKADKVEAVELLKKAREFCDEVQSPRSAAIYRSEQIQSYLSRQEQGEKT